MDALRTFWEVRTADAPLLLDAKPTSGSNWGAQSQPQGRTLPVPESRRHSTRVQRSAKKAVPYGLEIRTPTDLWPAAAARCRLGSLACGPAGHVGQWFTNRVLVAGRPGWGSQTRWSHFTTHRIWLGAAPVAVGPYQVHSIMGEERGSEHIVTATPAVSPLTDSTADAQNGQSASAVP